MDDSGLSLAEFISRARQSASYNEEWPSLGESENQQVAKMTRLILSTSNITMDGPSVMTRSRPGSPQRSNLELTNSLRNNFRAAQRDYSPPQSTAPGINGISATTNGRIPTNTWTSRSGNDLYIPTIDYTRTALPPPSSQYDTTVKLFFLPTASPQTRPQDTRDAISLVLKTLKIPSIDLLIISFPGLSFANDCEWEADKENSSMGNTEEEVATWPVMEELVREGVVGRLGLAEFGSEKLRDFLAALENPEISEMGEDGVKKTRIRPQVDQINIRDCCNVPPPLVTLAKQESIQLLTHTDCVDVLPSGTLRELLGQGEDGAGILSDGKRDREDDGGGMKGDVMPTWVVKYTAVVRDRGVIGSKGYFAAAELKE